MLLPKNSVPFEGVYYSNYGTQGIHNNLNVNIKGADQPVYSHSLVSAFVVSRIEGRAAAGRAGLSPIKTGFHGVWLIFILIHDDLAKIWL